MPELKWGFGYPGAIIFMILAGLAPYLFLRLKYRYGARPARIIKIIAPG
ncbi:hypothetical protein WAJ24_20165 [Acinetobacter baumannii]